MDPVPAGPAKLRFTEELRQNPQLLGFAWLQEAGHYCSMIEGPFGRRKSDGLPALSIDAEGCEEVRRVDCFTPLEVARAPREHVVLVPARLHVVHLETLSWSHGQQSKSHKTYSNRLS